MKIEWLGHAAFLITSEKGVRIITDPYEPGGCGGAVAYEPIKLEPDIVTISHDHSDHNCTVYLAGNPRILNSAGNITIKEVAVRGFDSFHDEQKGKARGQNIIFSFLVDGMNVVHLGDLGHLLDDDLIEKICPVDILMIPVGGVFTIGPKEASLLINKIRPRIAIAMHFKTKKLNFNIEPAGSFLRVVNFPAEVLESASAEFKEEALPGETKILVLQHSH